MSSPKGEARFLALQRITRNVARAISWTARLDEGSFDRHHSVLTWKALGMERGANSAGAAFKHIVVERILAMDRVGINDDELWMKTTASFTTSYASPERQMHAAQGVRSMVVPETLRHPRFLRLDFLTSKKGAS